MLSPRITEAAFSLLEARAGMYDLVLAIARAKIRMRPGNLVAGPRFPLGILESWPGSQRSGVAVADRASGRDRGLIRPKSSPASGFG
jgi:hypothetical protein